MVPKVHPKGSSFAGAAAYLLHDKDRADTAERVEWTATRNLATDNPHLGWRVMVATALDQNRLKEQAGIANTGRKSSKHVLHLTLSWHPEQNPTKEQMLEAADGALGALKASDRQALIVAHNDELHPHIHLMINRVSPRDGRLLSSSNDRLALSKWAESYERDHGKIYCDERVLNNRLRAGGSYVKGERNVPRHVFEALALQSSNDNSQINVVKAEERKKDHALALKGRNMTKQHNAAWSKLDDDFQQRKADIARTLKKETSKAEARIANEMRPEWKALYARQDAEKRTFESLEKTLFGRTSNMVRTIQVTAKDLGGAESGILRRSFGILTNAGQRLEYFEKAQARDRAALAAKKARRVAIVTGVLKAQRDGKLGAARKLFLSERKTLFKRQEIERDEHRAGWAARNAERNLQFSRLSKPDSAERRKDNLESDASLNERANRVLGRTLKSYDFDRAHKGPTKEQDNKRDRDDDIER